MRPANFSASDGCDSSCRQVASGEVSGEREVEDGAGVGEPDVD